MAASWTYPDHLEDPVDPATHTKHSEMTRRRLLGALVWLGLASLLLAAFVLSGCANPSTPPTVAPSPISQPTLRPTWTAVPPVSTPRALGTPVSAPASPTPQPPEPTVPPTPVRQVGPVVGALAPDFTLPDLNGNPVSLSSLRGRPLVLNFWATWCPPCRMELPDLVDAHQAHRGQDLTIVAVSFMENPQVVREFASATEMPFPVLLDEDGRVGTSYRVRGLPSSFFIDEEGVIVSSYVGPMTSGVLAHLLTGLLE